MCLCDAANEGYTRAHLHDRVRGHRQQLSVIVKRCKAVHGTMPQDLLKRFKVLKKCKNKCDCLVQSAVICIVCYNFSLIMESRLPPKSPFYHSFLLYCD